MTVEKPKGSFKGKKFTVTHCKGALDSYLEAVSRVEARKRPKFARGIMMQIQRLADGHRMSRENFPVEGDLPALPGKGSAGKFSALKKIPLRAYCWRSKVRANEYFISHYTYKDYDKLQESDTKRVGDNWKRIEVDGDER